MKPQEKVVTAQDIESSLYYVHVDSEKDAELLKSEEEGDESLGPFTAQECQSTVQRKPVLPPRCLTQEAKDPSQAYSHLQPPSCTPHIGVKLDRKPVGQRSNRASYQSVEAVVKTSHQKVLGPRPMHNCVHTDDGAVHKVSPQRQNTDLRRWYEQSTSAQPPLPPRPYDQKRKDLDEIYRANSTYLNDRLLSMEESRSNFNSENCDMLSTRQMANWSSLTLIRRYDYMQSNVGKIFISSLPSDPLMLDLTGLGYSKFVDQSDRSANEKSFEEQEQAVYRCQLQTIGSTKRSSHDFKSEQQNFLPTHKPGLRTSLQLHGRSYSDSKNSEHISNPPPTAPKGYTFQSPWNGTCDFATGVAGRSLKCRHSHPSRFGQGIEVSELRFNLPSSKTFTPAPKSLVPHTPRESKRSSLFSHHHRRQGSFESFNALRTGSFGPKVEPEDRLDLSLGQEHAGGGFGGRQAKLGKLIVEPEGLQMLDLVVAANMALWWRVYDRMA